MNKPREPKRRNWRHWQPGKGPGSYRLFLRHRPGPVRWRQRSKRLKARCFVHDRWELGARNKGAMWLDVLRFPVNFRLVLKRRRNKALLWR